MLHRRLPVMHLRRLPVLLPKVLDIILGLSPLIVSASHLGACIHTCVDLGVSEGREAACVAHR